tara:strand:- start:793 stop:1038 length:246 start_codon:yes stop_codon:yes gene_type:complete
MSEDNSQHLPLVVDCDQIKVNKNAIPIKGRRVLISPTRTKAPIPALLYMAHRGRYLFALLPFLLEWEITSGSIDIVNTVDF